MCEAPHKNPKSQKTFMNFELRSNGKIEIELKPETDIERAFVIALLVAAKKGSTVKLEDLENGESTSMVMRMDK